MMQAGRVAFFLAVTVPLLCPCARLCADEPSGQALLTLDRIFSSEFESQSFGPLRWLKKNIGFTTKEASEAVKGFHDIIRHDPATGNKEVLVSALQLSPPGESTPLKIEDYSWSPNEGMLLIFTNSKRVWRQNTRGDYWIFDLTSRSLKKLGGDAPAASLMFAQFSPDGRKAAFVRERNIFIEDLTTHSIVQLTKAESEHIINGTFDWVYEEEFGLRNGIRWSPDSTMIAFWQLDTKGVGDYYIVDNIDGLYQKLHKFQYPKVGTTNSACRVGVIAIDGKSAIEWIEPAKDSRNHYIARMEWKPGSKILVLQHLNRLQNRNDVLAYKPNPPGNSVGLPQSSEPHRGTALLTETDKCWVDVEDSFDWLDDNKEFVWLSERDGWRRAYAVATEDGKLRSLTGKHDVIDVVSVDEKSGWLYYRASPENAAQKYLYRAKLDSSKDERVTPTSYAGTNSYDISPDGKWAIHTHSRFDTPPTTQLVRLPEHETVRVLASNEKLQTRVKGLKRQPVEFYPVPIGDGVELDAWRMKPADFDAAKKYPLLFYVYGEPAAQTVVDEWNIRYLWHLLLTQQGYVVMSVDNRGTPAPRGRDWRKFIYRHMGELAPQDQAAAARAILKDSPFVDPERVGVWGWSGGGTMSLHCIFRFPDIYRTAISVAPVTNERYYDTIYSERYMGLPQDNVKGYRDGSAITYAKNLKGNLLLIHGTADDNVHYANTEALVNELIARNKQFDMLSYPNRSHAIREGENTRRHLFSSMTRFLHQHLLKRGASF